MEFKSLPTRTFPKLKIGREEKEVQNSFLSI